MTRVTYVTEKSIGTIQTPMTKSSNLPQSFGSSMVVGSICAASGVVLSGEGKLKSRRVLERYLR